MYNGLRIWDHLQLYLEKQVAPQLRIGYYYLNRRFTKQYIFCFAVGLSSLEDSKN